MFTSRDVAKFSLRKTGFVPGEPMMFEISIENKSTSSLVGMGITLIQTVKYTGYSDSVFSSGNPKYHEKVNAWVLYEIEEEIEAQKTFTLHNYALLPAVAPSLLEGCNIISTMYQVSLRIPVGWSTTDLTIEITVGTVPLREPDHLSPYVSPPQRMSMIDPPPSYEECVFGRMTTQSGESIDEEEDADDPAPQRHHQRRRELRRMPSYPYYHVAAQMENCSFQRGLFAS
nr:hypothetical protein BaRGS_011995 [Batillaria attramentaria]